MYALGVIRDKQASLAAEVAREEYFFCGPRLLDQECFCLSQMTSEVSDGSLLTANCGTCLLSFKANLVTPLIVYQ